MTTTMEMATPLFVCYEDDQAKFEKYISCFLPDKYR